MWKLKRIPDQDWDQNHGIRDTSAVVNVSWDVEGRRPKDLSLCLNRVSFKVLVFGMG